MSSSTLRIQFVNVTLAQLYTELDKLRFAGWGNSDVAFASNNSASLEIKLFRNLDAPTPQPRKDPAK